jgi:phospholipase/carboxylesterase
VPEQPASLSTKGRGASAEDLVPVLPAIIPGNVIGLFPNAPFTLDMGGWGVGYAWYDLGPEQSATIAESRQQLLALLDEAAAEFGVPPERTLLAGFSQGAVMTFEAGLRCARPLAGLIALSGYIPEPSVLAQEAAADRARPILIAHGTRDEIVPVEASRIAHRTLTALGYPVEYREYPIGHNISPDEILFIRDWTAARLG